MVTQHASSLQLEDTLVAAVRGIFQGEDQLADNPFNAIARSIVATNNQ